MDDKVISIAIEETETKTAETSYIDAPVEQYEVEVDVPEFGATSNNMTMDEVTVGVTTADSEETIEIDIEEAVGWAGGDNTIHDNLAGKDAPDQHPITSIIGLRTELDQIETLQTVYSDKKQQADYYLWYQNENEGYAIPDNPYGLFVSLYPSTDNIVVCNGTSDVFGVTVAEAAFVGNQAYVQAEGGTKTGRDGNYCLVMHSGLVGVRCETTVAVGDYVMPNSRGEAQKSDGDYGYLVTALSDVGTQYAFISLSAASTLAKKMADDVEDLSGRMSTAEYNITSVTNVANSAYVLAKDAKENADVNSAYIEEKVAEVLGRMDATDGIVGNLSESVNNACETAAMAKVIADGAVSSANAMKDEAVAKANEALVEATNTKKEVETKINEINTELDNTNLELQAAKESFDATIDNLKLDTEGQLADFKEEVSDNYATTTQLATVKNETSEAIAAVKQEASDTYATQEMLIAYEAEASKALAGFKQEATDTYATQEMLTTYKNDASEALAAYKTEVQENYATQEMVTALETDTTKALTDYKQEVTDTYATQKIVSDLETATSKALADYKQEVKDDYATQEMLTNLETDTTKALADYRQEVTDTYATQEMLTTFDGTTNTSIANIKQKADENGAKIEALVSNIDKYAVGEYSQAYGLTLKQTKEILPSGTVYVPTTVHSEKYTGYTDEDETVHADYTREFSLGYYYTWDGTEWDASQSTAVSFSSTYFAGTTATPYWVVTIADVVKDNATYDLGGLYKWENSAWVKVASVADNTLSRAVSAIKQTADSVSIEVANVKGDMAGLTTRVGNAETSLSTISTWKSTVEEDVSKIATIEQKTNDNTSSIALVVSEKDGEEVINVASIVTAINDGESSIALDADHIKFTATADYSVIADNINMNGYVTISSLEDKNSITTINGAHIQSGTIISNNYIEDVSGTMIDLNEGIIVMNNGGVIKSGYEEITAGTEEVNKRIDYSPNNISVTCDRFYEYVWKWNYIEDGKIYEIPQSKCSIQLVAFDGKRLKYFDDMFDQTVSITYYRCSNRPEKMLVSKGNTVYIYLLGINTIDEVLLCVEDDNGYVSTITFEDFLTDIDYTDTTCNGYINSPIDIVTNGGLPGYYILVPQDFDQIEFTGYSVFYSVHFDVQMDNDVKISKVNLIDNNVSMIYIENPKYDYSIDSVISANTAECTMEITSESSLIVDENSAPPNEYGPTGVTFSICATGTKDIKKCNSGAIIDFSDDPYITFKNFSVDVDGNLEASNVVIEGAITATTGKIGGCEIHDDGSIISANNGFKVDASGSLFANQGMIGGCTINTDGSITSAGDYFQVSKDGNLIANEADITGDITATGGNIGGLLLKKENIEMPVYSQYSNMYFVITGTTAYQDDNGNTYYIGTKTEEVSGEIIEVTCENENMHASFSGNVLTLSGKSEYSNTGVFSNVSVKYVSGTSTCEERILSCEDNSFELRIQGGTSVFVCDKVQMVNIEANKLSAENIASSEGKFGDVSISSTALQCGNNKLNLSYIAGNVQEYEATINYSKSNNVITVNLNAPLKESKTFSIRYSVVWDYDYKTCSVTIGQGKTSGSTTVNAFWGVDNAYFISNGKYLNVLTFNQGDSGAYMSVNANLLPETNGGETLGIDTQRWKEIWCSQSSINSTSDRNEKNSIECLSDKYDVFFDELQPVRYKFNQNDSNRYHVGFIAQDVEEALNIAEIPTSDFAGYLAYEKEDGSTGYGLRYSEFIALNTYEIQKLKKKIETLEEELNQLKTQQND